MLMKPAAPALATVIVLVAIASLPVKADIVLPSLISDNMVVQGGRPFLAWGKARPDEAVQVDFLGDTWNATADAQGNWEVLMGTFSPGGPYTMVFTGDNTITVSNVLVGEVWLGSGQSNMVWAVNESDNAATEIANATYPDIRLFKVGEHAASEPLQDVTGSWVECNPSNIPGFSAVAYFFGREIHQTLNRPIGLIQSGVGGTRIETWMSHEILVALDKARGIEHESEYFNGMIAGLQGYSMRGVLWYQGESNAWDAGDDDWLTSSAEYREFLPAMIQDWRSGWDDEDLFFLIVQLPNYGDLQDNIVDSVLANIRAAQLQTALSTYRAGIAITLDLGEADNIHPTNKQDVGHRLALNARALLYGETSLVHSGPIASSWAREGSAIRISFDHVGSGLVPLVPGPLTGFVVAADGEYWQWADAEVDGDTVLVQCVTCPDPIRLRYAWDDNPLYNLGNEEGLPASPFQATVTPVDEPHGGLDCGFADGQMALLMIGLIMVHGRESKYAVHHPGFTFRFRIQSKA